MTLGPIETLARAKTTWEGARRKINYAKDGQTRASKINQTEKRLRALLRKAVRQAASDTAAASALRPIYPGCVDVPSLHSLPILTTESAAALFEIENRYIRVLRLQGQSASERASDSLQRQAALIDLVSDCGARTVLMDGLVETAVRHTVAPNSVPPTGTLAGAAWYELSERWNDLLALPSEAEVEALGDAFGSNWAEKCDDVVARVIAALRATFGRAYSAPPPKGQTDSRPRIIRNAADAPMRGTLLRRRLACWVGLQEVNREAALAAGVRVSEARLDWFERARPADNEEHEPWRILDSWLKHIRRLDACGVEYWRPEWYAQELTKAICSALPLLRSNKLDANLAEALGHTCITAIELGAPPISDSADERYPRLIEQITERVEDGAGRRALALRAASLQPGSSDANALNRLVAPALMGEPLSPVVRAQILDRLKQLGQQTASEAALTAWISRRLNELISGARLASSSYRVGLIELPADDAIDLVLHTGGRARRLLEMNSWVEYADGADIIELLIQLAQAVATFTGRPDPAIAMAVARHALRSGHYELAEKTASEAVRLDARPRTRSIVLQLLAELELRRSPNSGEARLAAFRHLVESFDIVASLFSQPLDVIRPLILAAKIAGDADWFWHAAQVHKRLARAKFDPEQLRRWRLLNVVRWRRRREAISSLTRALVLRELVRAADGFPERQEGYHAKQIADGFPDERRLIGLLAELVPDNDVVPRLVRDLPAHRLHAFAVALHRHAPSAISERVALAALERLNDTPEARTFITSWIVRRYFDDDRFNSRLAWMMGHVVRRRYGREASYGILRELPPLMTGEVARRCREMIVGATRVPAGVDRRHAAADHISGLLNGGLVRLLEPVGYAGGGQVFIDGNVLWHAFYYAKSPGLRTNLYVARESGAWVEAKSAVSVLGSLRKELTPSDFGSQFGVRLRAASLHVRLHEGLLSVESVRSFAEDTSARSIELACSGLRSGLASSLASLHAAGLVHRFHGTVEWQGDEITAKVDVIFREPRQLGENEVTPWADPVHTIRKELDELFGVHLGRLSSLLARDVVGNVGPLLHRGKSAVLNTSDDEDGWLAARGVILYESTQAALAIARPPEENAVVRNLREIMNSTMEEAMLAQHPLPAMDDVPICIPEDHLRLVFNTVFSNAYKALQAGGKLEIQLHEVSEFIRVDLLTPWNSRYPAGERRGVNGAAAVLLFWGGGLQDGPEGKRWRVTLWLPKQVNANVPKMTVSEQADKTTDWL